MRMACRLSWRSVLSGYPERLQYRQALLREIGRLSRKFIQILLRRLQWIAILNDLPPLSTQQVPHKCRLLFGCSPPLLSSEQKKLLEHGHHYARPTYWRREKGNLWTTSRPLTDKTIHCCAIGSCSF